MKWNVALLVLLSAILQGCGARCDPGTIPGHYRFAKNSHEFKLELRADGAGTFTEDEATLGSFVWEVDGSSGQVLIHARSEVIDALMQLAAAAPPPQTALKVQSGYFAVAPSCSFGRVVRKLDLDEDGLRAFDRSPAI